MQMDLKYFKEKRHRGRDRRWLSQLARGCAVCAIALLYLNLAQAAGDRSSQLIRGGCSSDEVWEFQAGLPKFLKGKLESVPKGQEEALLASVYGNQLKRASAPRSFRFYLGTYIISRSFIELNLLHSAFAELDALVSDPLLPRVGSRIFINALRCLNKIHSKIPSLRISPAMAGVASELNTSSLDSEEKEVLWEAAASLAASKLTLLRGRANIDAELKLLNKSGIYYYYVKLMESGHLDQFVSLQRNSEIFLRYLGDGSHIGDGSHLEGQKESVLVNLGRIYYAQGNLDQAIQSFDSIPLRSRLFPAAILQLAWSYLMKKEYRSAADGSLNLISGRLKNVFVPEAYLILAISLLETCHYQEVQTIIRLFRSEYGQIYKTLYDWHYKDQVVPLNYYSLALKSLKNKIPLPSRILTEWIRSPVFIAKQQELNQYHLEFRTINELVTIIRGFVLERDARDRGYFQLLIRFLRAQQQRIPGQTRAIAQQITSDLRKRNQYMVNSLVDAYSNAKLIEADVYKALGRSMLDKAGAAMNASLALAQKDSVPTLNWGTVRMNGKEESWEDELGSLDLDLTNVCKKK